MNIQGLWSDRMCPSASQLGRGLLPGTKTQNFVEKPWEKLWENHQMRSDVEEKVGTRHENFLHVFLYWLKRKPQRPNMPHVQIWARSWDPLAAESRPPHVCLGSAGPAEVSLWVETLNRPILYESTGLWYCGFDFHPGKKCKVWDVRSPAARVLRVTNINHSFPQMFSTLLALEIVSYGNIPLFFEPGQPSWVFWVVWRPGIER